jgi:hypothetical protein
VTYTNGIYERRKGDLRYILSIPGGKFDNNSIEGLMNHFCHIYIYNNTAPLTAVVESFYLNVAGIVISDKVSV